MPPLLKSHGSRRASRETSGLGSRSGRREAPPFSKLQGGTAPVAAPRQTRPRHRLFEEPRERTRLLRPEERRLLSDFYSPTNSGEASEGTKKVPTSLALHHSPSGRPALGVFSVKAPPRRKQPRTQVDTHRLRTGGGTARVCSELCICSPLQLQRGHQGVVGRAWRGCLLGRLWEGGVSPRLDRSTLFIEDAGGTEGKTLGGTGLSTERGLRVILGAHAVT